MSINTVSDFDLFRQMQTTARQEEEAAQVARLIPDGTFEGKMESYTPIAPSKLPHAGVEGYRLTYNVNVNGEVKKAWFDVYFTPVSGAKGLVLPSKLGVRLVEAVGMAEGDKFTDVLERARYAVTNLRIGQKAASNGYKARNTVWDIKSS